MSTGLKVRLVPWLAIVTSACLAWLLPNLANAESPYPQPTGIMIPIPITNPEPSSRVDPFLKTLPKTRALLRSPAKVLPKIEYSSLPSNSRITDPATTGNLPDATALGARIPAGFSSLVSRGAIALRGTAPTNCLPGSLLTVVANVAERFGPVSVESTHRSKSRNWRVGGAPHSLHIACRAIDFRVKARTRGVMVYLSSLPEVGGLKIYRNGIIHIDNGTRRSW